MKFKYSKLISVTLVLVVVVTVFTFPTTVYAGAKPPQGSQTQYAVFANNGGDVGTQIGSDNSPVTVDVDQYLFVCIQQDFTQAMQQMAADMGGQWRPWGVDWSWMATIGASSSTDWEYWNSNYADHTDDEIVPDGFDDTEKGNHIFESDYAAFNDTYPSGGAGLHESWFVIQAPSVPGHYEIRWYGSAALPPVFMVDITVAVPGAPRVSTVAASSIGDYTATLNGDITDLGDSDVVERGFDWGFTTSYTDNWTETPGPYSTGTFNHPISGLDSGTTYHFRAKCRNTAGWAYGQDMEFTTTGPPSHPYLQIVQTCPEKDSETWWEWIVVNITASTITVTEVRVVDNSGFDWVWVPDNTQGYPTGGTGWKDGDANGYYWEGSETVSAYSAKVFRSRPKQTGPKSSSAHTMTWSATITGEPPPSVETTVVGADRSATGGVFYNKPGNITEQTEATTYPNGLYTYLYEDSGGNPLEAGTQYTFYVNVHEWLGQGNLNGTLDITIPEEFTNVALVDYTDFFDVNLSGGSGSDWTITGKNAVALKDGTDNIVDHLSFTATTPTGYSVNTNWEFDTRFTGTGGKNGTDVYYITEANVKITTIISITVTDGVVAYGTLATGATQDTTVSGVNNTQTATNEGNVAEKFYIKSSNAVGGTNWTLGAAQGDNTFTHKASIDGGSNWSIAMIEADTYYELVASVPAEGYQTFDLQIGMPTTITDYGEHTITVTILATAA